MNNKPLAKSNDIVVQEIKDECLLFDLKTNKAFSLNPAAYFIWRNSDGETEAGEIAELFNRKFKTKIEEDYIFLALNELEKANLLVGADKLNNSKISRRKVLIKYGMMAAMLPIVTGIIAPKAVHAQSGCATGEPTCSISADCPPITDPTCFDGTCQFCAYQCTNNCCILDQSCF